MPQLLRFPEPTLVDPPASTPPPLVRPNAPPQVHMRYDLSYEADSCRRCPGKVCDRHLSHAHKCSSSINIRQRRHDYVRDVRFELLKEESGYTRVERETLTSRRRDRSRADVEYWDETVYNKKVRYFTDDTGGHPLLTSHFEGEQKRWGHCLRTLEANKSRVYARKLQMVRAHPQVLQGRVKIVYLTCAFTSLGGLGEEFRTFISAASGKRKQTAKVAERLAIRADGLRPQQIASKFTQRLKNNIQWAILRGNAEMALSVGV
jgi:hypothetical protein